MAPTDGRRCIDCRVALLADAPAYAVRCKPCFAARRRAEFLALATEVESLRAENARLRAGIQIEPRIARRLLQLAHPDRHGGSALAHEVTQWLLARREVAVRG